MSSIAIFWCAQNKPEQNADVLIILGAKVLDEPIRPSHILKQRLDAAVDYLMLNPNTAVVVCGGQGGDEPATEASVMKHYLITRGIAADSIYEEDQSSKTAEQFIYAQALFPQQKMVVVTSDFHLLRSLLLAKRSGIEDISELAAKTGNKKQYKNGFLIREPIYLLKAWLFDYPG